MGAHLNGKGHTLSSPLNNSDLYSSQTKPAHNNKNNGRNLFPINAGPQWN